jgi:hypothetical protein
MENLHPALQMRLDLPQLFVVLLHVRKLVPKEYRNEIQPYETLIA